MSKYYSISGSNGCAVMSSWANVEKVRKYFISFHCKGFISYSDAEEEALSRFTALLLYTQFKNKCEIPGHLELNKLIFAKNLIRANEKTSDIAQ